MIPFLAKAFLTLFVLIDPVGLVPIFITLVGHYDDAEQSRIARRAILIAGGILLAFSLGGTFLLSYLGISVEALQVAAGVLLFKIALDMVFVHQERETFEEEKEARLRKDVSVFPLAIPLIAGPGTLASLPVLANEAGDRIMGQAIVIAIAALVLVIAYVLLRLSQYLAKWLGQTGINVVTRILGVLLSALAVQYIADGVKLLL
jgi:multiple antibiotic resistance protein